MSSDQPEPEDPFGEREPGADGSVPPPSGDRPPGEEPAGDQGYGQGYVSGPMPGGGYGGREADPLAGIAPLAHRGRRLLARVIDWLLVGIPVGAVLLVATGGYDLNRGGRTFVQEVVYAVVYFVYEGLMLTSRGQTVGKMAMNIRVAMLEDGSVPAGRPGWSRAATYALPPIVPCCGPLFWLVNVSWVLWDKPYHQALHDKVAQTVVVWAGERSGGSAGQ